MDEHGTNWVFVMLKGFVALLLTLFNGIVWTANSDEFKAAISILAFYGAFGSARKVWQNRKKRKG